MRQGYADELSLYTPSGGRKYLNAAERQRAIAATTRLRPDQALFALVLAWTGARLSEVLALTPASFQVESSVVAFRTLKRRKHSVREVPIPPGLMRKLNRHFKIAVALRNPNKSHSRLWPWSRTSGWRAVKRIMAVAKVVGCHACPRGLRHGFGVGALQAGIPLNLLQRWLGHARLSSTAIYASAIGPEELAFAAMFWAKDRGRATYVRRASRLRFVLSR